MAAVLALAVAADREIRLVREARQHFEQPLRPNSAWPKSRMITKSESIHK
jgi:hypothetical protein